MQRAQTLWVTARGLRDEVPFELQAKAVYLPNGVQVEHFQRPKEGAVPCPPDLVNIPQPRALFVGTMGSWLNIDWVLEAARALPQLHFVFVGPERARFDSFRAEPNLHLLGPRPYGEVPSYMHHSQVGIIPFQNNALTQVTNPVKVFEYCAAALPVVATRLRELEFMASPALLASSAQEFIAGLRTQLNKPTAAATLLRFAQKNTWDTRMVEVQAHLGSRADLGVGGL